MAGIHSALIHHEIDLQELWATHHGMVSAIVALTCFSTCKQRVSLTCSLCEAFPAQPLACRGLIVVLQHPYEAKRKFATVPLLQRALAGNVLVLRGRTLKVGSRDSSSVSSH